MDTMNTQTLAVLAILALAVSAIAAWPWRQRMQSRRLEQRFGPEYARTVDELGSRPKAEAETAHPREARAEARHRAAGLRRRGAIQPGVAA